MNSGWYVQAHQQVSGNFSVLGLWIFGALYLWSWLCDLLWAIFRFTEQINEFQLLPIYVGIYGSLASHLGALLSLVQALQFQNELLNHFFIMNLTLCPWQTRDSHQHPFWYPGRWEEDLRGRKRGRVNSSCATLPLGHFHIQNSVQKT